MAEQNYIPFLGRVPIDTVLVGLLDAVSKGEVEATGLSETNGTEPNGLINGHSVSFPLLDRYMETTSSKVWKGIAEGVVKGIEHRKEDIMASVQSGKSTE